MENQTISDPAVTLRQLALALRVSRALHAAALLDVAGLLADGPRDSTSLAAATGTDAGAMRRLMRALSAFGVFNEPAPDRFAANPISDRLRAGAPNSMQAAVLFLAGDTRWRCWSDLLSSLRTGGPVVDRVLGMSLFEYYAAHPDEADVHEHAMASLTAAVSKAVLAAYDFSRFHCAMDIGGGNGRLLADVLVATPTLSGMLFDLPHVSVAAQELLAERGLTARCRIEGGSFFDGVPQGADLHLLKAVVHDWDDPRAVTILRACRAALRPHGTLLLIERLMPECAEPSPIAEVFLIDLEMLLMTGGRERTKGEFRALLDEAGFALRRIVLTTSPFALIEAAPV